MSERVERLLLETSALKLFITLNSKIRLEWVGDSHEFELIEDAIEFIGIHPEWFDEKQYTEFFEHLTNRERKQ